MYADYLRPDHIATSKAWTVKSSVVKTAGLESSTSSSVLREVIAEWLNHHDPKTEIATDLMLALKRVHSAPSNIPVPTLTPILVLLSGTSISFTTICQPFTFTTVFYSWDWIDKHWHSRVWEGIKGLEMSPTWELFGLVAIRKEFSTFFKDEQRVKGSLIGEPQL